MPLVPLRYRALVGPVGRYPTLPNGARCVRAGRRGQPPRRCAFRAQEAPRCLPLGPVRRRPRTLLARGDLAAHPKGPGSGTRAPDKPRTPLAVAQWDLAGGRRQPDKRKSARKSAGACGQVPPLIATPFAPFRPHFCPIGSFSVPEYTACRPAPLTAAKGALLECWRLGDTHHHQSHPVVSPFLATCTGFPPTAADKLHAAVIRCDASNIAPKIPRWGLK